MTFAHCFPPVRVCAKFANAQECRAKHQFFAGWLNIRSFVTSTRRQQRLGPTLFEEIFEIADDVIPDAAEVAKARLRVDTRKWALARMNPRKYGDKVTNELVGKDGGAIQIETSPMSTLFGK